MRFTFKGNGNIVKDEHGVIRLFEVYRADVYRDEQARNEIARRGVIRKLKKVCKDYERLCRSEYHPGLLMLKKLGEKVTIQTKLVFEEGVRGG